MDKILVSFYESPAGDMVLGSFQGKICLCDWLDNPRREATDRRVQQALKAGYWLEELAIIGDIEELKGFNAEDSDIILKARMELDEYFAGKRMDFSLPVIMTGSPFQCRVWNQLRNIPYGETISYSELARRSGNPKGVRTVATAVACNPMSIILPCHRVIGSDGSLTGYAGGIPAKTLLLNLESQKAGKI